MDWDGSGSGKRRGLYADSSADRHPRTSYSHLGYKHRHPTAAPGFYPRHKYRRQTGAFHQSLPVFSAKRGGRDIDALDSYEYRKRAVGADEYREVEDAIHDGEPEVYGGAGAAHVKAPQAQRMMVSDTEINITYNGAFDIPSTNVALTAQTTTYGPTSVGPRRGREVNFIGYEYRLVFENEYQSFENQATYNWPGHAGIPGIGPQAEAIVNTVTTSAYTVPAGGIEQAMAAGASPGVSVPPKVLNPLVPTVWMPTYNFVDQFRQANPGTSGETPMPPWTAPAVTTPYGYLSGEMCTTRVVVFIDHEPQASYALGGVSPTGYDIFESYSNDMAGAAGIYRMDNLNRFTILEDTTWSPISKNNHMVAVRPSRKINVTSTFGAGTTGKPESNALFVLIVGSDNYTIAPPDPEAYTAWGVVRFFYEDTN